MAKASRSRPFSLHESHSLCDIIGRFPVVENKGTTADSIATKQTAWIQIAVEYNALGLGAPRTVTALRNRWKLLKKLATKDARLEPFEAKNLPEYLSNAVNAVRRTAVDTNAEIKRNKPPIKTLKEEVHAKQLEHYQALIRNEEKAEERRIIEHDMKRVEHELKIKVTKDKADRDEERAQEKHALEMAFYRQQRGASRFDPQPAEMKFQGY